MTPQRFEDLPASGLLWAINKYVLHPRGLQMSLAIGDDGAADCWIVTGDGSAPLAFSPEIDVAGQSKLDSFVHELLFAAANGSYEPQPDAAAQPPRQSSAPANAAPAQPLSLVRAKPRFPLRTAFAATYRENQDSARTVAEVHGL